MSDKTEITIVVPDELSEMSVRAMKLCELFVAKVLDTSDPVIEVKIDQERLLATSNNRSIRELFSIYLKSGSLAAFYKQLVALATRDAESGGVGLKILFHNNTHFIRLEELRALPNLHLVIRKLDQ